MKYPGTALTGNTQVDRSVLDLLKKINEVSNTVDSINIQTNENTQSIQTTQDITMEPTGFDFPDNVVVTHNPSSRTFTLTGTFQGYYNGVAVAGLTTGYTTTAYPLSPTVPYFYYYDGTDFVWSSTPWTFTKIQIVYVEADGSGFRFGIRETHGLQQWQSHLEDHQVIGTYLTSGGDITGVTLSSTTPSLRRPITSAATIKDEDLSTINSTHSSQNNYTQFYLSSTNTINWTTAAADFPRLSTAQPYWNYYTGGNWTQQLMTNNSYMSYWLIAIPTTADAASQNYRFVWIQGQSEGTLLSQQQLAFSGINLGTLASVVPEFIAIARVIIRYLAADWTVEQIDKLLGTRGNQTSIGSGYLASVATNASLTGLGTVVSPLGVVYEANTANIKMDGTVAVGVLNTAARGDHIHASDTSRLATSAFTDASVYTKVLGAYVAATGTITNTDTIETAIEKLGFDKHVAVTLGTASGLSLLTQTLSLGVASSGATGALSSTDWSTFNGKQAALNGTGFIKASGATISYDNSTYYKSGDTPSFASITVSTGDISFASDGGINYSTTHWVVPRDSGGNTHIKADTGGIYLDAAIIHLRGVGGTNDITFSGGTVTATTFNGALSGTATNLTNFNNMSGSRDNTDYNSRLQTGFYNSDNAPPNGFAHSQLIVAKGIDTGLQIAGGYNLDNLYFRGWNSSGSSWTPASGWRTIIHSGNIASQSVASVTHNAGRTDSIAYPIVWMTGTSSPAYSCAAVTITSSTGTINTSGITATSLISASSLSISSPNTTSPAINVTANSLTTGNAIAISSSSTSASSRNILSVIVNGNTVSGDRTGVFSSVTGTATSNYGVYVSSQSGTINYGVFSGASGGTSNYAFYASAGACYFQATNFSVMPTVASASLIARTAITGGYYMKFSDRTMIAWAYTTALTTGTTVTVSFGVTFSAAPVVITNPNYNSTSSGGLTFRQFGYNASTTGFTVYGAGIITQWVAIGTWV